MNVLMILSTVFIYAYLALYSYLNTLQVYSINLKGHRSKAFCRDKTATYGTLTRQIVLLFKTGLFPYLSMKD